MTVRILIGDVRARLAELPGESVHCVVTSPPYFGLRSYHTEPQVWGGEDSCQHHFEIEDRSVYAHRGNWPDAVNGRQLATYRMHTKVERGFCRHCGAWRGDLGLEPTPRMYIEHMVEIFREVRRVLRRDGTCWVNIGDSFAWSSWEAQSRHTGTIRQAGLKPKDLIGIPWTLAFALRDDGWGLRRDIIWAKPNPMPESCDDRCTSAHEYLFHFSKSGEPTFWTHRDHEGATTKPPHDYRWQKLDDQRRVIKELDYEPPGFEKGSPHWRRINLWKGHDYFYDGEAIKEPAESDHASGNGFAGRQGGSKRVGPQSGGVGTVEQWEDVGGRRNKRSVWTIATAPFPDAHFATYPPALVEPCILAGTSARGVCPKCGAPWVPIVAKSRTRDGELLVGSWKTDDQKIGPSGVGHSRDKTSSETIGWRAGCGCDAAAPVPATVLDPFLGSGTTALVADRLGRNCIGIELSADYAAMAERRIRRDGGMFADIRVETPEIVAAAE